MPNQDNQQQTIEDYFSEHQTIWNNTIRELGEKMKNVSSLPDLLNVVYCKRQDAVDYYHLMLSKFATISRDFKKLYADAYNSIKQNSNIRYSTESAINAQVDAVLRDQKYQVDVFDNHIKYMWNTIKSIDNLIYGINTRIEIEKLIQGVKF